MQKSSSVGILLACLVSSLCFYACAGNDAENENNTELLSVVAISRHGIRSPTSSSTDLLTQRSQGFPLWPSPANTPGNLSTVGQQNATRLGAWYRDFYTAEGILPPMGTCPATGTVFVYADVFERTIHTARGYLHGLFQSDPTPDCGINVIHSNGQTDPYIDTAAAGICKINSEVDLAAFTAAIGSPASLANDFASELQTLQTVTQCCQPAACGTTTPASCSLQDLPNAPSVDTRTGAVAFPTGSLFNIADYITETFELEYAQGMPDTDCATTPGAECVAWGAISPEEMSDLTKLHVMNMDLSCRLPSFAQVGSSNLMWQLVGTMDQTLSGVKNKDILAPVESRFTLFVAHDENISAIGGFLGGLTWKVDGFQQNDPDPTGALVFELHRVRESGELMVRLFYVTPTLDQMRYGTTLTLESPPQRIAVKIPACGGALACPYERFKTFIADHVRQDCLVTADSRL